MQQHEYLYRLAVEQVADYAIFMIDPEGRMASWSAGVRHVLGWDEADWNGQTFSVIFPSEDVARGDPEAELRKARANGCAEDDRWQVKKDGTKFWASGITTALRDQHGNVSGFLKVMRDLTERKQAEVRQATQHAVTTVLAEAPDLREAVPKLLQAICNASGWQWGALWGIDKAAGLLRLMNFWNEASNPVPEFEEASRQITFAAGVGLPGRVWATAAPGWVTDVSRDTNFPRREAAARAGLHGALCFPVTWRGEVLGVMEFFSPEVRPPDQSLLDMMAVIGGQIGQFIDRKQTEDRLRAEEARRAASVRAALDCIVSMDHEGRVTEWNPAAEHTFGYARDEALGREMAALIIPPSFRQAHREGLARYLETGEGRVLGRRFEITAVRKDGTEFPVELTIIRLPAEGPPTFTGYIRDITDQKRAEEERQARLEAEQAARAEAEQASRMKDEFLATLSHELRTPLSAILGWSHILSSGSPGEQDLTEGLRTIERNARAQTQIIEDLLDMSRIISGKVRLDVQRIDLASVVREAVETAKPSADAKSIRLQAVLDPHAGPVSGDPARLQQVMWNLLSNAVKFTPKGGRVQVVLERINSHLEVSVTDTGEGIAPEFLPHVFDRFRQADGTTTRRHGGLGLGLSLVRQLVELHGGSVRVKSLGAGHGTTFTVSLPPVVIHPESEAGADRPHPRVGSPVAKALDPCVQRAQIAGVKVLVVDDEPDARTLIKRLLEDSDAVVLTAGSAAEALQLLQAERPDVLATDIGMAHEDGYSLIRRVRALGPEEGGRTPAVALTAYARAEDRVKAMLAGFQIHLAKPVEPVELIATVASLAGRTEINTGSKR